METQQGELGRRSSCGVISHRETDCLIQRFLKIYLRTPNTSSQAHKLFNCFNIFKNQNYEQGVLTLQFGKMWTMSERGARLEMLNRRKRQKEYNTEGRRGKSGELGQCPCLIAARDSGLVPLSTNASWRIHMEHQQPAARVSLLPKHKTTDEL